MRRLVFIGNCQVQCLSQLYQRFSGREGKEQVVYLPSYEDLTDERSATIAKADVVIEQRMDLPPRAALGGLNSGAERHFVPLLGGGFLWPFSGQARPGNETPWFMPNGPYGGEMSDGYLNRMIAKGVPAAEAADDYLAADVNKLRNLDRFFELIMDRQRSRDAACGYDIADLIEEHFRDEPVFSTPYHPNLRLTLRFATQFFHRMNLGETAIKHLHERLRVSPFPTVQLPIHPSVARHFELTYADARTRYRFHHEGRITFAEYALRYMTYDWNRDLAEGIELAGRDAALALRKLESGLARSPSSAHGWSRYADALRRSGRPAEAETAMRRAIAIDETDGVECRYHIGLGHILAELGRLDEAAQAGEHALAIDPFDPHVVGFSANIASRRGRLAEAEALVRRAIGLGPANANLHSLLGDILLRLERPAEAVAALRCAIDLAPGVAAWHMAYSHALARTDRIPEAIEAARRAASLDPDNAAFQARLAALLACDGGAPDAEAGLLLLLRANPEQARLHEQHGHLLARLGRPEQAEAAFRRAMDLAPNAAGPLAGLSHTLLRLGRQCEAVAAIDAAIAGDAGVAAYHVHRGNLLRILRQTEAAAAAYREALALDPANQDAARRLQGLQQAMAAVG